ncbi:MAG: hypothetical protein J6X79_01020 [Bacteroidales bacterium]|nr:hypothetical protein [Bacteroidales bacterium]
MAKVYTGAYGTFKNRFKDAVQYKWRGIIVGREYNDSPANPNTAKQKESRAKFKLLSSMAAALKTVLRFTLQDYAVSKKTTLSGQFLKQNYGAVTIIGQDRHAEADYEEIALTAPKSALTPVSLGEASFSTPKRVVVPIENGYIDTNVNSASDRVFLVVYNTVLGLAVMSDGSATRSDSEAKLDVPGNWQGDYVEVWAFLKAADNTPHDPKAFSATLYAGTGTIA